MQQTVAAQRRYFESGATRPLTFRLEMLTRLELGLARWEEELLAALKADLNKDPYEGYMCELALTLGEVRMARKHLRAWARPARRSTPEASSSCSHRVVLPASTWAITAKVRAALI